MFQAVAFYQDGAVGWTEVYYMNASDYPTAVSQLQAINTARMGLSLADVTCIALRVSDVTIKGDALLAAPTTPAGTRTASGTGTADASLALNVTFTSADFITRVRHYLRGLCNNDLSAGPQPTWTPIASVATALSTYISTVLANSVAWVNRAARPPVSKALSTGTNRSHLTIRKVGRPFGLQRGRR